MSVAVTVRVRVTVRRRGARTAVPLGLGLALALAAPRSAHAVSVDSLGEGILYGGTSVAAAFTTIGNGVGLAYDQPASPGWRIAGGITGAAGVTLGTLLLADRSGTATSIAVGAIPLTFGVTSILTAIFVDDERVSPTVVPLVTPAGPVAGAAWVVSF